MGKELTEEDIALMYCVINSPINSTARTAALKTSLRKSIAYIRLLQDEVKDFKRAARIRNHHKNNSDGEERR